MSQEIAAVTKNKKRSLKIKLNNLFTEVRNDLLKGLIISIMSTALGTAVLYGLVYFKYARSFYLPMETYAGKYVQIVYPEPMRKAEDICSRKEEKKASGELPIDTFRYTIIDISFNPSTKNYTLIGHQYRPAGQETTAFSSDIVNRVDKNFVVLKFIWKTDDIYDPVKDDRVDGYTEMLVFDDDDGHIRNGTGFFIGFHQGTDKKRFYFFQITPDIIKKLNIAYRTEDLGAEDATQGAKNASMVKLVMVPTSTHENVRFVRALDQARADPHNQRYFRTLVDGARL